ncbi:MAG: MarC family protein [Halieaceae bacterium]|nr:MarC family protein [Halieaceae bacterium]
MDIVTAFLTILFVMDPLGNVPVFLSVMRDVPESRRVPVIVRELLFALVILALFLVGGPWFLDLLQVKQESISIAGGIIMFIIALKMIFPMGKFIKDDHLEGEPFLVPLATPCIAGPSTMAVIMLFVHDSPEQTLQFGLALVGAWLVTAAVLLASPLLFRLLGQRGLIATERLMGMLLVIISVQMFFDGIDRFLNT